MTDDGTEQAESGRRHVLASAAAAIATGLVGYVFGTGTAAAQSSVGEVGTAANPYVRAYANRVVLTDLEGDPSNPPDGTLWYNSEA